MVKVKLRVPLSSAPRETSSPLTNPNPLRSAPDYSDDDEETTPQPRNGGSPSASTGAAGLDEDDEAGSLNSEDEDEDELDELDELEEEDEDGTPAAANSSTSTPKRRSITLKPRSSAPGGGGSSASPSGDGSASPANKVVRRGNQARIAQVRNMTVEELDALPAAKRRKTAKARGAAGPGRGWRKGLTKGQKPVYELPSAETTPATFGDTTNARSSPAIDAVAVRVKSEGTPTPSAAAIPKSKSSSTLAAAPAKPASSSHGGGASSSIKIVSGPGGQTFTGDLSAKAGTAKNPGFRYPPLPSSRAGPPVQPIARIPTAFQTVVPLERTNRQPRRWLKAKREILSMGGRPWSIPVFYGGEDRGYEKKVDVPMTTAPGQTAAAGGAGAGGGGEKAAQSKAGTPSTAIKTVSPTPTPTPTAVAPGASVGGSANTVQGGATKVVAAGGSPLPPPKHLGGLTAQSETNWRGQSPAFLFGGR
ncbi:uncharacterized protein UDID_04225 [Ustilago sp. UG-2017a]|nr:uncharacterized protein UDID_04225 [Ustilago sp. UG-2017a]